MTNYYSAPSDKIFDEIKDKAIELWTNKYPADKHPYYTEKKVASIKNLTNLGDNFMYIVAMFDMNNQTELGTMISDEAKKEIRDRLIDGGTPKVLIPF